jgi:hypothetical protein
MAASRSPAFRGRARERQALDGLLGQVRGGESAVLVVRGEAGIGKTALMRYCARQAAGCRLAQIHGVESEMQFPLAALHQLCTPMLSGLDALPEPQRRALRVAFGLAAEPPPDLFVLGLAVLSLLAENAAGRPLVCLVDDAQWLDEASSQVLGFVGRRLLAEPVGLALAVREGAGDRLFPGLPTLTLEGLTGEDAAALLTAAVPGHLDQRVCDRIVAETGGNPLGLLELASGMSEAELAGGFADPPEASSPGHLQDRLHEHYVRRVRVLPEPAQQLMLLAAADPTGDATLLWRAAQTLGLGPDAAGAAAAEQLLSIGSQVRFRHPLVRSAAYAAGSAEDRRTVHLTLAAVTDARADPERRVWHLSAAASGPDEDVAAALEQAAAKIKARAGLAASAAFLRRSVALTAEPRRHTERALAAALASLHVGAFDIALGLLAQAEAHAVDDLQRARVEQLRGQVEWASVSGRQAPVLLLQAARTLESLDPGLARETYLHAWVASHLAGPLAGPGGSLLEVSLAAQAAPPPVGEPRPCELLLDGLTTMIVAGRAAAEPALRRAVTEFIDDRVSGEAWLQWGIFAQMAAIGVWDFDGWAMLSARHVELARAAGALAPLCVALNGRGQVATQRGDFEAAASLTAEKDIVTDVTGTQLGATCDLLLAGYRGRPDEAVPLLASTCDDGSARGEGLAVQLADWSAASTRQRGPGGRAGLRRGGRAAGPHPVAARTGPRPPAVRRVAPTPEPAARRPPPAARRPPSAGRDRRRRVRRARALGAARHRREGSQTRSRRREPAHPARGAHRPAGQGRAHQPRDRGRAVHQRPRRRMAPAQGVRQAGHHLPPGSAPPGAPARAARHIRLGSPVPGAPAAVHACRPGCCPGSTHRPGKRRSGDTR